MDNIRVEMEAVEDALNEAFDRSDGDATMDLDAVADLLRRLREGAGVAEIVDEFELGDDGSF